MNDATHITDLERKISLLCTETGAGVTLCMNRLSGKVMEQLDASIQDKEQRQALKNVIKSIIWDCSDAIQDDMAGTIIQFFNQCLDVKTLKRDVYRVVDFQKVEKYAKE